DSAEAFEDQKKRGLVTCPLCGEREVNRVLSAVRSVKVKKETRQAVKDETTSTRQFLKAVKEYFVANFEDVGADFAKEALKIHYGVKPSRNIRGSSTDQEEEILREEGIEFMKVPLPKDVD
ncbi:MAG: DUF1178 family protein, partial [Deltaproteobacteria bacterium]|nr:DUF1178 family protein [Deltaproteobacteria bacterium]